MQVSNKLMIAGLCAGFLLQGATVKADAIRGGTTPKPVDVTLNSDGLLVGQVVNSEGTTVPTAQVAIYHRGSLIAKTFADDSGRFAVRKLRGGIHQVSMGQDKTVVRLWSASAAPPAARTRLDAGHRTAGQRCPRSGWRHRWFPQQHGHWWGSGSRRIDWSRSLGDS